MNSSKENVFSGIYGDYTITLQDEREVKFYRLSVLLCAFALFIGLTQWILMGPQMAWIWLIVLALGLGSALKWIHIYLKPLHKTLLVFWAIGCIGLISSILIFGPTNLIKQFSVNSIWTITIGPLFASLTGLGFKEFFCFRRPEAIGLTLLVPISLLGHISHLFDGLVTMGMLFISALLLLVLALRKFGMDAAADVGDKSIFEYLDNQQQESPL